MIVKLGDLVCLKKQIGRNTSQEIWLVIGWNSFGNYIRVQSVNTGEVCQYNLVLLKHFKSEEVCK